ncbi:hypothetical protein [Streptomyces prunicolor]
MTCTRPMVRRWPGSPGGPGDCCPGLARWTAEFSDAARPCVGKVGTWYSWLAYDLTAPL